jgi:hypothetical protein
LSFVSTTACHQDNPCSAIVVPIEIRASIKRLPRMRGSNCFQFVELPECACKNAMTNMAVVREAPAAAERK